MSDIKFRTLAGGDEEDLIPLCDRIYNLRTPPALWHWKYLTRFPERETSYVAEWNDKIVAMAGIIPYCLKVRNLEIVGAQLGDLMADPVARKKNVFLPIVRKNIAAVNSQMDMLYGFCNDKSLAIYSKRFFKDSVAFRVPKIERLLSLRPLLNRFFKTKEAARPSGHGLHKDNGFQAPAVYKGVNIWIADRFDEGFDRLWEGLKYLFDIATVRNSSYLNWRYHNHPMYIYRTFCAGEEGEPSGFVTVACRDHKGLRRGYVMDFLAPPARIDIQEALLGTALKYFRRQKVDLISGWMFSHAPYYGLFKRHLFRPRPGGLTLMANSFHDGITTQFLTDPLNWYVTLGDCDSF